MISASAPGRVNLIGEHTDYNGGYVLPMAIPQRTRVRLEKRGDGAVRIHSAELGEAGWRLGQEARAGDWTDYLQGIPWVLRQAGFSIGGFDARIDSSVPLGSGLSSSAALEVSVLRALREAFSLQLDDVQLALLAQKVETEFVGAPVGVMDQMASSLADEEHALFLDTRTLETRRIALPPDCEIVVISSGVKHSNVAGEYRTRRAECEQAAKALGVPQLREVTDAALVEELPEPLRRRARHVVTEDARVLETVLAFERGDATRAGQLFVASHESMRDDFQVSIPEIDLLVECALRQQGILGARLTGGGFGGSTVALARRGSGRPAGQAIVASLRHRLGNVALLVPPPTP